jgi:hypothetical protein
LTNGNFGVIPSFATVGPVSAPQKRFFARASVVLKAGCSVGISDPPILQALHKVIRDTGGLINKFLESALPDKCRTGTSQEMW